MSEGNSTSKILDDLRSAVIDGDAKAAGSLAESAIENGMEAQNVVTGALVPAMDVVGERFRRSEYYVPEVLLSSRAMKAGMSVVNPLLGDTSATSLGSVVIGTVKGDLHDIGKNLVAMMLEGAGFQVHDVGTDCDPQSFVSTVKEHGADIVAMSALLTTTMGEMRQGVEALHEAGLHGQTKVIVGGAPVTQKWADDIGADAYAADAASAVTQAKRLLGIEVEESSDEAANRLLGEARDRFEVAIREAAPEEIKTGIGAARELSERAREKGADVAALERLVQSMEREEARYN